MELRNVPRYEYVILAAGPAALYEIPSVSYVLMVCQMSRNLFKYRDRAARDSCQNDEYETLTITNIELYAVDPIETAADDGFTQVERGEQESGATAETPGGDPRSVPRSNLQILSCKLISKVSLFIELFRLWPGC